tara:strand:+ start:526 stop:975 length:450 start_codon:yes stop_codon:yes gene_type:complete
MIIECLNCNKKFNIDSKLIPEKGRQMQCGSCSYSWFFKKEENLIKPLVIDKNINLNNNVIKTNEISKKINQIKKNEEKFQIKSEAKVDNKIIGNFFSYLIVLIISLISLIILIDTIKKPLFNIFPGLEIMLFNLFETLKDIKLFIIDLT